MKSDGMKSSLTIRIKKCSRALKRGFTLLEVMIAIVILAIVSTVAFQVFSSTLFGWKRGIEVADGLTHGNFAIGQLVSALDSTIYFFNARRVYAFRVEKDNTLGIPTDTISFVTASGAFMPPDSPYSRGPHRLRLSVDIDEYGDPALFALPMPAVADEEEFEDEYDAEPMVVARGVSGLEILFWDADAEDWTEEWEPENSVPERIEVTLYIAAIDKHEEPMLFTRVIDIPVYDSVKERLRSPVISQNNNQR